MNTYNRYKISFLAWAVFALPALKAQDIHFSQYFSSPLSLSPANTGNCNGDWRIMANYRSQWKQIYKAYTTQSIGGDINYYLFNEQLSGGLYFINDKSGGSLSVQKILLSGAYHKKIGKHALHGGLQPGYVMKRLGEDNTFPNQFSMDKGKFDAGLPNNESNLQYSHSYLDVNIGAGYAYRFKRAEPYLYYSVFHLNFPKESFFDMQNKLKPRQIFNLGLKYSLTKNLTLEPMALVMFTAKASEIILGSNVHYKLDAADKSEKTIVGGIHARYGFKNLTDAAYLVAGMQFKNYYAGISYDVNISELHTATTYRGAIEISLIYTALNSRLNKLRIPCDRY